MLSMMMMVMMLMLMMRQWGGKGAFSAIPCSQWEPLNPFHIPHGFALY